MQDVADLVLECPCGHKMRVPDSAMGTTGLCPKCGGEVTVDLSNTRPLDLPEARKARVCDRCGRPFRGDWDRTETTEGTLCHICANLAGASVVKREAARPDPAPEIQIPEENAALGVDSRAWARVSEEESKGIFAKFDDAWRYRKGEVILLGVGFVIALAVVLFWPDRSKPVELAEQPAETVSTGIGVAFVLISFVTDFLTRFLALYLYLYFMNKLPNEDTASNLFVVGAVALGWAVFATVIHGLEWLVAAHAFGILGIPIAITGALVVLYVFDRLYDLSCGDLVSLSLILFLCRIIGWTLRMLALGILGFAATG